MENKEKFSTYYQAQAESKTLRYAMGILRNQENWAFIRTLDKKTSTLEFFIAPAYEEEFAQLLQMLLDQKYLSWFKKLPNRLIPDDATVD